MSNGRAGFSSTNTCNPTKPKWEKICIEGCVSTYSSLFIRPKYIRMGDFVGSFWCVINDFNRPCMHLSKQVNVPRCDICDMKT